MAGDHRRDAGEVDWQADQTGVELSVDAQWQVQGLILKLETEGRAVVDAEAVRIFLGQGDVDLRDVLLDRRGP